MFTRFKKLFCLAIIVLVFCSWALADLQLSYPQVNNRTVRQIEAGASPTVKVRFFNPGQNAVEINRGLITLRYDPKLIDTIIESTPYNEAPAPGELIFNLNQTYRIAAGETVDLASVTCHVNQANKQINNQVALFRWDIPTRNVMQNNEENVTGRLTTPPRVLIAPSTPPEFKGLSSASCANALGLKDPGNTIRLDWQTPAGAFDQTKFKGDELSFRVFRSQDNIVWEELSPLPNQPQISDLPDQRSNYTGNVEGSKYTYEDKNLDDYKRYYYKVTAYDNTAPNFNEQTSVAVLSVISQDRIAPDPVAAVRAMIGQGGEVLLTWQNPPTADLGGVVIIRNKDQAVLDNLLENGKAFAVGDEPFGAGNGQVVFVTPQESYATMVPKEYSDYFYEPGIYYYQIYTYDQDWPTGSPQQMGLNYSVGQQVSLNTETADQVQASISAATENTGLKGAALVFPNPFRPNGTNYLTLQYNLSSALDLEVIITDIKMKTVNKFSFIAGQAGATAGINNVEWEGKDSSGVFVSSGLHVISLVSRQEKKVLGRARVMIYR